MARDGLMEIVAAAVGAVALVIAAVLLACAVRDFSTSKPSVTVRGAAELPVVADVATWTLNMVATGDDLRVVQRDLNRQVAAAKAFLVKNGLPEADVYPAPLSVNDSAANSYRDRNAGPRFTVNGGVVVRTEALEAIGVAKQNLQELVEDGVTVTNSWGPNYAFTRLNDFKPKLVTDSTAAARAAADQFAEDAGVTLGGILSARQGTVQILGRDDFLSENEQINKVLRVVTTVDYKVEN